MFGLHSHGSTPLNAISINNNSGQGIPELSGPNYKFINCKTGIGTVDTSWSNLVTTEQTFQQSTTTGGGDPTYNIQVFGTIYFEEPINNNNVINGIALNVGQYLYIDPAETYKFTNLQGTEIERVQITAVDNVNNRVQYFAHDYAFTGINATGDGLVNSGLGGIKLFTQPLEQAVGASTWYLQGLPSNKSASLIKSLGLAQGTPVTTAGRETYTIITETILKLRFEQSATGYTGSAEMILTIPAGTTASCFPFGQNPSYGTELVINSGIVTAGGKGILQQTSDYPHSNFHVDGSMPDYSWFLTSILRA